MNSEIEFETSKSVWNVMMNISNMKSNGGILITNDDDRIEVIKVRLENNTIFYLQEDGKEDTTPLLSIKEARPLSLDHELPTRRDEAPIDDRDNDKEFTPEFCIEFTGGDVMEPRLSSRKDYRSYDVEIPPPSKLKRSQACYDCLTKKRKLEEDEVNTPILSYSENALLEFPELRPAFIEPLSPRNIKVNESKIEEVEMIPKSEYNRLEDDFARLLKLMFNNNYSILQDACESGYKVKIRDTKAEQRVYSVMYTFENKEELFTVLVNEQGKTLHMNVQDIITVIPSISKEKPFYEREPINISDNDYWKFIPTTIDGIEIYIHRETGIVTSKVNDTVYFEALTGNDYGDIDKVTEWVKRCGIKVYEKFSSPIMTPTKQRIEAPHTPIRKERRSVELRAPRKERKCSDVLPECARKLDFSVQKEPTYLDLIVRAIKELKQRGGCSRPLLKEYIKRNFKQNINSEIFDRAIRQALVRGLQDGVLVQNKQSFKLSDKAKKEQKIEKVIEEEEDCTLLKECKDKHIQMTYEGKDRIVIPRSFPEGKRYIVAECMRDKIEKRFIVDKISNIIPGDKLNWRVYGVEAMGVKEASSDYDEYFKKPDVKNALREASRNNKSIFIKYAKGSIPDIKRPIRVIGFQNGENGNDLVVAECLIEGSIRKFKIEHIEIVA